MNGPQPICTMDIMAFCALAGIYDPAERMMILHVVQVMDAEFMAWAEKQRK